jgi:hypothetical protein
MLHRATFAIAAASALLACSRASAEAPLPCSLQVAAVVPRYEGASSPTFTFERTVDLDERFFIRVALVDCQQQPIAARTDLPVTLSSPLLNRDRVLVIPAGENNQVLSVSPVRSGIMEIRARAINLPDATLALPVGPPRVPSGPTAIPVSDGFGARVWSQFRKVFGSGGDKPTGPIVAVDTKPDKPAPSVTYPPAAGIKAIVSPNPVQPTDGTWTTHLKLYLVSADGAWARADAPVDIAIASDTSGVSPDHVTIPAGSGEVAKDITITGTSPSTSQVQILSRLGPPVTATATFAELRPSKIVVLANPTSLFNDGHRSTLITAILKNATNGVVKNSGAPIAVSLAASIGELRDTTIDIGKDAHSAATTLNSVWNGESHVTVQAPGLEIGETTVRFVFPWWLLLLAAAGGTLGALARSKPAFKKPRWQDLLLGLTLGLVVWILALFGALEWLPQLGTLPAMNYLGSPILGFLAGYGGRLRFNALLDGLISKTREKLRQITKKPDESAGP